MGTWFLTRHLIYPTVCWSVYHQLPLNLTYGCYAGSTGEFISTDPPNSFAYMLGPYLNLDNPICFNPTLKWMFLGFLLVIEGLSILWFSMIVRVAYGVIRGGNAEDSRSDEEDEAEIEDLPDHIPTHLATKEGAAGDMVEGERPPVLGRRRSNGTAPVRARGRGRVPFDQSDRKALLGRIGCEKPT